MKEKKVFIIRKYIKASSAKEALRIEKRFEADDCWVDEEHHKQNIIEGFRK